MKRRVKTSEYSFETQTGVMSKLCFHNYIWLAPDSKIINDYRLIRNVFPQT